MFLQFLGIVTPTIYIDDMISFPINLRAYDLVSQEIRAAADPKLRTLCTKNMWINKGIKASMAASRKLHTFGESNPPKNSR
ncbi:hypothetical protein Mp_2g16280 [Marchantia polymorpha subsp. ruderalis]|uniref:Uncharacterized protein n=1 Tax=Marchantia polymorpha TaxID=3197 RepID=A0A2R6W9T3_MARPO|nr:hypothetical protein MARPO_0122s0036 [Marchantia polymorpha]BBN02561.1 hypothetical protein Mp_2g16280 [Marchantia polymorpha subsp. ruderalis]|eukprot:PTQ30608.1 hypothetical protein MARPO_0122s0036 [Marchantia polymorpha]